MNQFQHDLCDYILSGHAMLCIKTHEKQRAIRHIIECAQSINRNILYWSNVIGWKKQDGMPLDPEIGSSPDGQYPDQAIKEIVSKDENTIFVLQDFGRFITRDYGASNTVIGWLQEVKELVSNSGQTIIFLGPFFEVPIELEKDITYVEFGLPDQQNIMDQIEYACEGVVKEDGSRFEPNQDSMGEIVNASRGMTEQQIIDRVSLALRKHKDLNHFAAKTILAEKASVVSESGLLSYMEPPEGGISIVGGYENIKKHIKLDLPCFSQEAMNFGITPPKGLLLVGVPGCGKTLLSIAIASEFNMPLISMDIGNLLNKYVGESEHNLREAIKIIEQIAPCVLQLDEIEKGFGGGDLDGGASTRIFGSMLKWLNDRTAPVYVIATANNISALPPEFSRSGRFDAVFGLDLPSTNEREQIISIHLTNRNRNPEDFDLDDIVDVTYDFTGADIEETVKLALKIAFGQKTELSTNHIIDAAKSIVPLAKAEPEKIQAIREWCKVRAKQSSANQKPQGAKTRKVVV